MASPWRTVGGIVIAMIVVAMVLAIDLSPAVAPRGAPTAGQVRAGHDALRRLRDATQAPPSNAAVAFSAADIEGIAALGANALRIERVAAWIDGQRFGAAVSVRPLPGLWLNLRAGTAVSAGTGFPPISASIGDLPLPQWLTRAGLDAALGVARARGAQLPSLDVLVQRFAVTADGIALRVVSPLGSTRLVRQLVAVRAVPVDSARVAAIYCRLVAANTRAPAPDLATQVARAFAAPGAGPVAGDPVEDNRAALVALAMLTVGDRAGDLANDATDRARACLIDPPGFQLGGRADLAKHWTLSAALGATVGGDVTTAMGEWKELSDSLPGGSGFSFVDLAADRAGLRFGRGLVDPDRAATLRAALAGGATLLPLDATVMAEGMTNADFVARYGSIDGRDYRTAVARIDALLDREAVLRGLR